MSSVKIAPLFRCKNVTEAWEHWYNLLESQHEKGFIDSSRDGEVVGEVLNSVTVIEDPTRNIVDSPLRNLNKRYMIGEMIWYNSGNPSLKAIQNITSAWDRMSDDGKTVNSNYGHKLRHFYGFDQWEYVKELLTADPNSRQAVVHIKPACPEKTKDLNCTICLQFFIRDGKLHLTVYMRSNDVWMGFPYDVFNFTCWQIQMAMELGVDIGTYTHVAGSLHLYARNSKQEVESDGSK